MGAAPATGAGHHRHTVAVNAVAASSAKHAVFATSTLEEGDAGASVQAERSYVFCVSALMYYAFASMGAQYFVKFLFTGYGFTFPLTVAIVQALCTVPAAYLTMQQHGLDRATAVKCLPLAIVQTLNVTAALAGTCGLSLPMFIALRRSSMLFTMALEWFILGRVHKLSAMGSTGLMIAGALIAAATDLNFNGAGYAAIAANNLMSALYLVMMKQPNLASVDSKAMLFYNSLLSVPLLGFAALAAGEPAKVAAFRGAASPGFVTVLALAGSMGVFITHATMVCTRANGPLTTSVVGAAKNILMTIIGMLAFNDFVYAPWNMAGLMVSACGTVCYAASEIRGGSREARESRKSRRQNSRELQ